MTSTKVRPSLMGALQEAGQRAVGAGLRHAVQIEPGVDLLAAARQLRALAACRAAPAAAAAGCARTFRRRRAASAEATGFGGDRRFRGRLVRDAACAFAARGFFRSGLVCLATLSHNARSSSLRRACGAAATADSGIGRTGRSFHRLRWRGVCDGAGAARRTGSITGRGCRQRHRVGDVDGLALACVAAAAAEPPSWPALALLG